MSQTPSRPSSPVSNPAGQRHTATTSPAVRMPTVGIMSAFTHCQGHGHPKANLATANPEDLGLPLALPALDARVLDCTITPDPTGSTTGPAAPATGTASGVVSGASLPPAGRMAENWPHDARCVCEAPTVMDAIVETLRSHERAVFTGHHPAPDAGTDPGADDTDRAGRLLALVTPTEHGCSTLVDTGYHRRWWAAVAPDMRHEMIANALVYLAGERTTLPELLAAPPAAPEDPSEVDTATPDALLQALLDAWADRYGAAADGTGQRLSPDVCHTMLSLILPPATVQRVRIDDHGTLTLT